MRVHLVLPTSLPKTHTLTVVDMQQLPDTEETNPKDEIFRLNW